MSLDYVIWNAKPQFLDFGNFEVRYYSLLFALGFVAGYIILSRIFKKDKQEPELIDHLTVYMVISTIIGARLGHCLFYEFDYYIQHPLEIILPWQGKIGEDFRFTGYQGLASHGAAIGILTGMYLFARKFKKNFLWVMDMVVLVTALAGAMIRTGNLMNSEIYGKPTGNHSGFVFIRDLTRLVNEQYGSNIEKVYYKTIPQAKVNEDQSIPLEMHVQFATRVMDEQLPREFGSNILPDDLKRYDFDNNVSAPAGDSLQYTLEKKKSSFHLTAVINGLPRHPSQIYEAVCYLLTFFLLIFIFYRYKDRLRPGFIFGVFLIMIFLARFFIEFIKENQEAFEDNLSLNMGQLLSLPFIIGGLVFIFLKWPAKKAIP